MDDAVRFGVIIEPSQEEYFYAEAYGIGMIGCEERSATADALSLLCYFPTVAEAEQAEAALNHFFTSAEEIEIIVNRDWNEEWKKTIEPVKVSDAIWVSPTWLNPPLAEGDHWVKIEPRMAFGTGHHETTRIASQAILNGKSTRGRLLDIGTGSGILLFIARLAGYAEAVGYEIDPDCDENLKENIALNGGDCNIRYTIGTVDALAETERFDTIVMNIIRLHSEPMLPNVKKHLTDDGEFIWSGILVEERDRVVSAAEGAGFTVTDEGTEGEWWYGRFTHA